MKPLRRKLQKCCDPDRADLVALQRARREQASGKDKARGISSEDMNIFGTSETRDAKRRKTEKTEDVFGPALG